MPKRGIQIVLLASAIANTIVLSGCAGMLRSDQPPERVYWLEPYLVSASAESTDLPTLTLAVRAAPGLDTDRFLLLDENARLNSYAGARWADHAPEVLASLLQQTLESSGRYRRVYSRPRTARTDWTLELELRKFFVETEPRPAARISLAGHLNCESGHRIETTATANVAEDRLSRIVAAYQQALNEVSRDLASRLETLPCP